MLSNAENKVEYKNVRDIDFISAKTEKKKLDQAIAESCPVNDEPKQHQLTVVQEHTVNEVDILFSNWSHIEIKPAILSLVPYRPKALDSKYSTVLSELCNKESGSLLRGELLQKCEDVFENITVTPEKALNCEKVSP